MTQTRPPPIRLMVVDDSAYNRVTITRMLELLKAEPATMRRRRRPVTAP